MTDGNFTWSKRFPLDARTIEAEVPTTWEIYSTYVVRPEKIVKAAGYVAGSEELVYIGATRRQDGGLRSRLGGRAGSVKDVLPVEDDDNSNLCLEEKRLIRLGLDLEFAFISGANSRQQATSWEGLKIDEYKAANGGRLPPGNKINSPGSK